jgi:hypothetical protein
MVSPFKSSVYSNAVTATADTAFRVEQNPNVILLSGNIHCYDNDAYYGNAFDTSATIAKDAVIWFDQPFKPSDFMFKNKAAGSNCKIVITGILADV